jgi:hypothetical protein
MKGRFGMTNVITQFVEQFGQEMLLPLVQRCGLNSNVNYTSRLGDKDVEVYAFECLMRGQNPLDGSGSSE